MKLMFPLALVLFVSCQNTPDIDLLDVGIPLEMATYRKQQVSDVVYALSFNIPEEIENPISSTLVLDITINDLSQPLYLDFNADAHLLKRLVVNGENQKIVHQKEHLIITENLQKGENHIEIGFNAGELSLNRNQDFLYTLLVPDRASTLFPCFDQPNIKAKYILDVIAPNDWTVITGAPLKVKSNEEEGRVHFQFEESDPMSTYLFSMVAGKFQTVTENPGFFDMTLLYRETDTAKVDYSIPVIYDLHQRSIDFLKGYTNYDFPFKKLDYAAIPGFQYGGMEHVGAIQYNQNSIFMDESATERRRMGGAKLIAHETSHMWFGDMVTMDWFNDVWMKEVFANFMADKIVNPTFPDINHKLQFMISHYRGAYGEDRTRGTNPIRQKLDNLKNAGNLYGGIIYNKAPIMMRQLEATLGEAEFREGIREYIANYAYGNATWNDLVDILDKRSTKDIKKWSEVWVNQSGRPIIKQDISYADGKIKNFSISQQAEDGSDKFWPQTFEVSLVYKDSTHVIPVDMDSKSIAVASAEGIAKPDAIIYNSDAFGYGLFPISMIDAHVIPYLEHEVARGYAYLNSYENTLAGNFKPHENLDLLMTGIQEEENEFIHGMICGETSSIFWNFLTQEEREAQQPIIENILWQQLQKQNKDANIKKNIFDIWKGLAYSDEAKEKLYRLWSKELEIADLKLNQDDYTGMAMSLALYGHEDAQNILVTAKGELTNQDKIDRFEFFMPALSSDSLVRDAFFRSLKEAKNREKESWVLTACDFIHHPLRQETAIKHVPMALDLLEEIQQTGDIFFPKRWLSSTVGQYQSKEAMEYVNEYLSSHPNLQPALKGKLLQATDDLYRFVNQH
ncbi:M1 family metallopeptidase [Flagellimonas zhangzhouensis]|nr:M1 family aminopeptidase [Allomuricauda zhangzhouensis]